MIGVAQSIAVVARYGRIDVLINNAGVAAEGVLATMRPAEIDAAIDLNLRGTIYLTYACSRYILQQVSGCIINVSSVNAIRGHSDVAVYSRLGSDLGLTSLDLAQLVSLLEMSLQGDPFQSLVPITSVRTVGDLCKAYDKLFSGDEDTAEDDAALLASRDSAEQWRRRVQR